MNTRLQKILEELKSVQEPMTSSEIASFLQVSSKTIRNDVKMLNKLLESHGAYVASTRGKGYQLIIQDEKLFHQFAQSKEHDLRDNIPSNRKERIYYLMERLLMSSNYNKIEDLADELYISRSTLQHELKHIRDILKKYDLTLDQKPYHGIKVMGDETQIRYCISEYLFNQQSTLTDNMGDWLGILPEDELQIIKNSVLFQLRKHHIIISDISLQNLITHIAIACKRIRESNSVQMVHHHLEEIETKKEFFVAKEIAKAIHEKLHVLFSNHEIAYLAIHLQGTKLANSSVNHAGFTSVIDDDIQDTVKDMVKRMDEVYGFHLADDEELLLAMSLHLKPAINRYKFKMNIRNPMLDDIKSKYPLSFDAALIGAQVVQEKMGITIDENEVGYLALHIEVAQERQKKNKKNAPRCLIVCASGLGSAQLLMYKLQSEFGDQLNIIGFTEYYNLLQQSFDNIDFVISTIPIEENLAVPVIQVSTILGETDLNKINTLLFRGGGVSHRYLRNKFTYLQMDFCTKEEVLRFICKELASDGKVNGSYVESVFQREGFSPTSFGNMVAIPHPMEPQTQETFWSVVTLQRPIQWGDKPVQLIVLLNISENKKYDLKPMYALLLKLLDDKNMVREILQCKTYEQLKRIIK
ncbi:BglG family transcription antiterminator [Virgibacillus sp. 179-BFC.A HS]|uniref:BglG family transcription antiterminator n=1 Tax=Tigheibacillus jepli TaxID=3035914 RepID=A0ABU5CK31_9BACI|nr:BglG family transcription antiterminator [Virgibacillus sp. 179-BFC.A HS]MDY0406717.1 BglG family transcription antiterminator [Virgibacillus sp. 179-BFC.A HS]